MTGLPLLATDDVQLRWARPEVLDFARHRMLRLLTLAERLRYEATGRREVRDSFLLGRVLVRELAAETLGIDPLEVAVDARCERCSGPHGRPMLRGDHRGLERMRISIAHCEGAVVAALAKGRDVGLDAVRARSVRDRVTAGVTTAEQVLADLRSQAVAKADGRGTSSDEPVRFRTREGTTEAWIEGSSRYFAVSEPAVHSALVVAVAVAQE
ncbi:4-phosphopantetheinyl transferase [Rathayibacter rathayi]|uniref:4-phosphopantetheinyl transferase n=1 Tax=Rathayibacter rathayi TaxID=33887 RepID=A0ABD6W6N8_RATRA|nr:4-phosphopantetheinyl transferase [Rathayibacter rathayi]AZZ49506.1 4-phosphopantetheinyl transferase [Rathayibacter rathayi]MWV73617.1 4-phosphopantetheinyl transferase [Rathayibacter rathayi NCPPB 2980 = VKM Ac-1601]PPF11751.1 4-phosphopantetheinyl transferase [Rathayibacter rathayi]PPF47835.1 4-phosphopantetheinyl transferase [Rathayibacter rathayi]PPF78862.1 4-phosphopantetheinyl transferase [Rathayibacter rathayi]